MPPQNGPSSKTHSPGQSAFMSQPGVAGSLIHVVPLGQGGRPRLPQLMRVGSGVGEVVVLLGVHFCSAV